MNTAVVSVAIFSTSSTLSVLSAFAQHPIIAISICALGALVALGPIVRLLIRDRREDKLLRDIIKDCGTGSREFKHFTDVLKSRDKSPP